MKKNVFWMIAVMLCFLVSACTRSETLFNGNDLSNWKYVVDRDMVPAADIFSVQDGMIQITGVPYGYIYTEKKYKNYTLELEWRWIGEASNSGIFLMIAEVRPGDPFPNGIECQLRAGSAGDLVMLGGSEMLEYVAPEVPRGRFPVINKREESNEKPAGEWNKAKIIAKNGKLTVYINGLLQNQGTNKVKEGHIGLQSEGGPVQFRNLRLVTR